MKQEQVQFGLRDELIRNTPDVWSGIHKRLAEQVASKLLLELEGIPSPEGKLFGEIRDSRIQKRAMGA